MPSVLGKLVDVACSTHATVGTDTSLDELEDHVIHYVDDYALEQGDSDAEGDQPDLAPADAMNNVNVGGEGKEKAKEAGSGNIAEIMEAPAAVGDGEAIDEHDLADFHQEPQVGEHIFSSDEEEMLPIIDPANIHPSYLFYRCDYVHHTITTLQKEIGRLESTVYGLQDDNEDMNIQFEELQRSVRTACSLEYQQRMELQEVCSKMEDLEEENKILREKVSHLQNELRKANSAAKDNGGGSTATQQPPKQ